MKITLPRYSSKDYVVMPLVVLPFTLAINSSAFGPRYFESLRFFLTATLVTGLCFSLYFILCGGVAVLMKNRFPNESQVTRRMTIMIFSFLIMSGLFLLALFSLFHSVSYFNYQVNEDRFVWAYFGLGIINIFLTFLHEGIARYESWKVKQKETDELREAYRRSRLQGLKSQVNPHFLFNSLNSLSSLISEEGDVAERFLDEMSKVYRYMLRGEDDNLVTLDTELKFLDSYAYLLQARYGSGLQLITNISPASRNLYVPALTMQIIIENAFTQNSIQKASPLVIHITGEPGQLVFSYNLQPKLIKDDFDTEAGLDNLVSKYQLLGDKRILITETGRVRQIMVPLLFQQKEVAV
ncbi:MAG: histidine kinase [Bacteroidetes bacterium]|nr:histidine kinase [Bacteroidota bacterium]